MDTRAEVKLHVLNLTYDAIQTHIVEIVDKYKDNEVRKEWAMVEFVHILSTLDKWAKTIESNFVKEVV